MIFSVGYTELLAWNKFKWTVFFYLFIYLFILFYVFIYFIFFAGGGGGRGSRSLSVRLKNNQKQNELQNACNWWIIMLSVIWEYTNKDLSVSQIISPRVRIALETYTIL